MLASQIRKKYLAPEEINEIISNSGFISIQPFLEEILKESRNREISAIDLLKLQYKIAQKMIFCEKQIAVFKNVSDRGKRNNEWESREIYKAHRKMLKDVMDGIAFRLLNFERPVLRQLAGHNQTGHLTEGFVKELEKAEYIVNKTGFYVILNDLTNFLRYGDLTIISQEGIMIDEVKTNSPIKGNQKKALDEIIDKLNKKVIKIGEQTAKYIKIPGKPTSFHDQVEFIINKSKQNSEGIYAKRVSPYLWISSIYIPQIVKYFKQTNKLPNYPVSPFPKEDISSPINSLMFFDEFSPNIMPYSTFPFSEKTICEIMTGQIQLKMVINEKELIKTFRGKGWNVIRPSKKDIVAIYDSDNIEKIKDAIIDPTFQYNFKKGKFSCKIPNEVLLRIQTEFRSAKSVIDELEGIMNATVDGIPRNVVTNFSKECLIWR